MPKFSYTDKDTALQFVAFMDDLYPEWQTWSPAVIRIHIKRYQLGLGYGMSDQQMRGMYARNR
jgi:hypothetical protein